MEPVQLSFTPPRPSPRPLPTSPTYFSSSAPSAVSALLLVSGQPLSTLLLLLNYLWYSSPSLLQAVSPASHLVVQVTNPFDREITKSEQKMSPNEPQLNFVKSQSHLPIIPLQLLNLLKQLVHVIHLQHQHIPEALQVLRGGRKLFICRLMQLVVTQP